MNKRSRRNHRQSAPAAAPATSTQRKQIANSSSIRSGAEYAAIFRGLVAELRKKPKSWLVDSLALAITDQEMRAEFDAHYRPLHAAHESDMQRIHDRMITILEKDVARKVALVDHLMRELRAGPQRMGASGGGGRYKNAKRVAQAEAEAFIARQPKPPSRAATVKAIKATVMVTAEQEDHMRLSIARADETIGGWLRASIEPARFAQRPRRRDTQSA